MNRVQGLIIQALNIADNNDLRQEAQNTIFTLLRQDPTEFFLTCARIVADPTKLEQIRQSAASVMKALLLRRDDHNVFYWDLVNVMRRGDIKEILLNNLVSPQIVVMRAGANVIAQIAAIEITRGEWLQLINSLAENSMHESINIRRASITTLGFICEELKSTTANINPQTCQQILGSLLLGLRGEGDIVEISLAALRESISFLHKILENQQCSNKMFEYCFPFFTTDYAHRVYEILYEYGKYCYHLLPPYIDTIKQITIEHLRQRNQYSVRALELWDTIGTEYIKRADELKERVINQNVVLRNFVHEMQEDLLPEVMGSILILDESDIDLPDLREGAVKTLGTFVSCCGRELVDKVTDGVSRIINSSRPGQKQASALLFSCLCFYPDKAYIQTIFINGFTHLYSLIDDPNLIVKKNTLNGFLTLSESFPRVFLKNKDIAMIADHLLSLSKSHDEDVVVLSLGVLTNITDQLKDFQCVLSEEPDRILQKLIEEFTLNLNNRKKSDTNEKIIIIVMSIVMATSKKNVLSMLIQHLITIYASYSHNSVKIVDLEIVHTQLIAIIHTCVLALTKYSVDNDLRRKVIDLIDAHIRIYGVDSEGINLISAAAISFKSDFFKDHFEKYWRVINDGLMQIEQKPVFKAALQCISDISRSNEQTVAQKVSPVFRQLIQYVQSNIDRELKTEILRCFGDLSLALKDHGEMFVDTLISISNECFEAVYRYSNSENERDYVEELKESLIEMYHCVIFALNEQTKTNDKLANHFPLVSTFVVRSCDISLKPTVDYLKLCLYLIFDSGLFYCKTHMHKQMALNILKSSEVTNLVNLIRKFSDRPDIGELIAYIEDKMRPRNSGNTNNWR